MTSERPLRVLSLDGGGMRGAYTATYLNSVADGFAKRREVGMLDVGAAFDLIVGTSVGGIVACTLAAGVPLPEVVQFFRDHGPRIFPRRLPSRIGPDLLVDLYRRPSALRKGTEALRTALTHCLKSETIGELYKRRDIALAITAIELSQHNSWVFKTPHLPTSNHRDDNYRLVDVCLATSAAPIFRSLASLQTADGGPASRRVFADGGLWANNPVMVSLLEGLSMAKPNQPVHVFCVGTCPLPAGEQVPEGKADRGLAQWKFGGLVAPLAIDAQEYAFDNMARLFAPHLKRECKVVRFPRVPVPAALMPYLDLDETRPEAIEALINQAKTDADTANSRCSDSKDEEGRLICGVFESAPVLKDPEDK